MRVHRLLAIGLPLFLALGVACSDSGPTEPPNDNGIGTIGPAGGTVRLDNLAGVVVPAGALGTEITITITAAATQAALASAGAIGQAYRFTPEGQVFGVPVEVFVFLPGEALDGASIDDVVLISTGEGGVGVETLAGSRTEAVTGGFLVFGDIDHFSVVSPAVANEPPTADAGPDQAATVGATVALQGSGSDPEGGALTFSWKFDARPAGSAATLSGATTATPSFVPDVPGSYVVRLTVEDPTGAEGVDTVTIQVSPAANQAPAANAGPDQSVTPGAIVTLDGSGSSDPDGDPLTFQWSLVSGPTAVTLDDPTAPMPKFNAGLTAGVYEFELTVSDGSLQATDRVRISVIQAGNAAPVVTLPDGLQGTVGAAITVVATASDPDGDPLTFGWSMVSRPAGSQATLSGAGATATFTPDVEGTYEVEVTVSDGRGGVASDRTTITVTPPVNQPPTGGIVGPTAVLVGAQVTVTAQASDPNGDPLTFEWSIEGPPGSNPGLSSDGDQATFTADVTGEYVVTVVISDGELSTAPQLTVTAYPSVGGVYTTEFRVTQANGCQDMVPIGATVADMMVDQPEPNQVIPRWTQLTDNIKSDPLMTLQPDGTATFSGIVLVGDEDTTIQANGTMTLVFADGGLAGPFNFSAFTCTVDGTLTSPPPN